MKAFYNLGVYLKDNLIDFGQLVGICISQDKLFCPIFLSIIFIRILHEDTERKLIRTHKAERKNQ